MGATEAINLDGGGSSTMVLKLGVTPQVVNSPIHTSIPGRERPVANHLGLRLLP
jgi:exopolysaccharide biosynthesis protein